MKTAHSVEAMLRTLKKQHGRVLINCDDAGYHVRIDITTVDNWEEDRIEYWAETPLGSGRTLPAALKRALKKSESLPPEAEG